MVGLRQYAKQQVAKSDAADPSGTAREALTQDAIEKGDSGSESDAESCKSCDPMPTQVQIKKKKAIIVHVTDDEDELNGQKKFRPRKPYVLTEARKKAFEKARAVRDMNIRKRQEAKQQEDEVKQLRKQQRETKKATQKKAVAEAEAESEAEAEVVVVKKPKKKAKSTRIVIESESESEAETIVVKRRSKAKAKPKKQPASPETTYTYQPMQPSNLDYFC